MKKLFFVVLWLAIAGCMAAQELPKVGDEGADNFIVRIAQSGWRTNGASLSYDGQTLYLSVLKSPREVYDLYVSRKVNGVWRMPELLPELSSDLDDLYPTVSSHETNIYFVRRDVKNKGKKSETVEQYLYCADRMPDGIWQMPQPMVVSNGTDHSPVMQADNVTLLFTSLREAGRNAKEKRYYIEKIDKYNWTLPMEIGDTVDESSLRKAFARVEGQVEVQGRATHPIVVDVYEALTQRRITSVKADHTGKYCFVMPLGARYKLDANSEGCSHEYQWEDCRAVTADTTIVWNPILHRNLQVRLCAYDAENNAKLRPQVRVKDMMTGRQLASAKVQENGDYTLSLELGKQYQVMMTESAHIDTTFEMDTRRDVLFVDTEVDVFLRVGKVPVQLIVKDIETGLPIASKMTLENKTIEEEPFEMELAEGVFDGQLRGATEYHVNLSGPGYVFKDTTIVTPREEQLVHYEIARIPLKEDVKIQLRNVQFEFNSYLLTEDSYSGLTQVAELLRNNPSLRMEVSAHTDDVGSDSYNQKLSQKRGESVLHYLVEEEGIDAGRMEAKGYGKTRPLVPNDSDENRALNRRVEFSIIGL